MIRSLCTCVLPSTNLTEHGQNVFISMEAHFYSDFKHQVINLASFIELTLTSEKINTVTSNKIISLS